MQAQLCEAGSIRHVDRRPRCTQPAVGMEIRQHVTLGTLHPGSFEGVPRTALAIGDQVDHQKNHGNGQDDHCAAAPTITCQGKPSILEPWIHQKRPSNLDAETLAPCIHPNTGPSKKPFRAQLPHMTKKSSATRVQTNLGLDRGMTTEKRNWSYGDRWNTLPQYTVL